MTGTRPDEILDEWDAVVRRVRRPQRAPMPRGIRPGRALVAAAPLLAAAIVVVAGLAWFGGRGFGVPADPHSPVPGAGATGGAPSAEPEDGCTADLTAAIVSWEGAAGSRIATIRLTNRGATPCRIPAMSIPALVDGGGRVLAQGIGSLADGTVTIVPGGSVRTEASVSNVCGDPPVAPVTIALDLQVGVPLVAAPVSRDDVTVPPCNGPGRPASIEIRGWTE
jgi:Protein of unknown function (DUF4232)